MRSRIVGYAHRRPIVFAFVTLAATATVVLCVFSVAIVVVSNAQQATEDATRSNRTLILRVARLAQQGVQSHDAQCAVADDYKRRIVESTAFLAHPPKRIAGFRVTQAVIVQVANSLRNLQATYDAMRRSGLLCGPPATDPPAEHPLPAKRSASSSAT